MVFLIWYLYSKCRGGVLIRELKQKRPYWNTKELYVIKVGKK